MPTTPITNITLTIHSDEMQTAYLACERDDGRFHILVHLPELNPVLVNPKGWRFGDQNVVKVPGPLYKNPLGDARRRDPGYFDTRHLDQTSGPSRKIVDDMRAYALEHDLVTALRRDLDAKRRRGAADQAAYELRERAGAAVARILAVLRPFAAASVVAGAAAADNEGAGSLPVTVGDLRQAASLLAELEAGSDE